MLITLVCTKKNEIVLQCHKWGSVEADIIRGMIKHENDLINHRLTWMNVSEAVLFTALWHVLNYQQKEIKYLMLSPDVIGIYIGLFSLVFSMSFSIVSFAADKAITNLKNAWNHNKCVYYFGPDVIGLWDETVSVSPPGQAASESWRKKFSKKRREVNNKCPLPWLCLPVLYCLAWLVIFFMLCAVKLVRVC